VAEAVGSGLRARLSTRGARCRNGDNRRIGADRRQDQGHADQRRAEARLAHGRARSGRRDRPHHLRRPAGIKGQRTGSNRHDGGNAADLELVARGRTLDFTRPADLGAICRFVASAAACGATGIGAGVNYTGPQRLHVGFGNGAHETTQVVWGEGGASANAPDWLREAAQLGWTYSAGAPVPDGAAPQPPPEGEAAGVDLPEGPGGFAGELDGLIGALLAPSSRADRTFGWMARGAVALIQLCRRLPVTGVPDAETWAILTRFTRPFRAAGWLIAALRVVGLAKSAGGSGASRISTRSTGFARRSALLPTPDLMPRSTSFAKL
jgi:Putative peptidoglycan binding domain